MKLQKKKLYQTCDKFRSDLNSLGIELQVCYLIDFFPECSSIPTIYFIYFVYYDALFAYWTQKLKWMETFNVKPLFWWCLHAYISPGCV